MFYDFNQNRTYAVPFTGSTSGNTASFNVIRGVNPKDFGFYPYYHSIFHQIVNDYTFYNPFIATGNTTYTEMVNKGVIKPTFKIGGEYRLNDLSFRAGILNQNAAQKNTNTNTMALTFGLGIDFGSSSLAVSLINFEQNKQFELFSEGLTDTYSLNQKLTQVSISYNFKL